MKKHLISRDDLTGQTTIPDANRDVKEGVKVEANCRTLERPATDTDWENHFNGTVGLGLSPLLKSSSCRWAALDVDVYPFNIVEFSRKFAPLPLHFCKTKSGGLHIYLFFSKNKKAVEVRMFLRQLCSLMQVSDKEFFPSSDKAGKGKDGKEIKGKWINLPYFGGNDAVNYAVHNGEKLSLQEFEYRIATNLIADFNQVLKYFELAEAPPCIQKLFAEGVMKGQRDRTLLNTAIFLKQKYPDDWIKRLFKINDTLNNPLPEKEIEASIVSQVKNKDIFYTCGELQDVCKRDICFTRQFGIGSRFSVDKLIGDLKKLTTDPPVWFLTVNDVEIDLTTEKLMNFNAVRQKVLEVLNILLPRVKTGDWEALLMDKMENLSFIEAPEDAGQDADFYYLLKKFCCDRSNATKLDEVEAEHVYIEDGMNYFKSEALRNYIKNKIATKYTSNKVFLLFKRVGGSSVVKRVKGKSARLWTKPCYPEQLETKENREVPEWAKEEEF